jgi:hypothetical protein
MGHTGAASPVVKLLIRPQTPTGPGAGNHKRTSPAKDTKSVSIRVTLAVTGLQPSSNHQTVDWILTVSIHVPPTRSPSSVWVRRRPGLLVSAVGVIGAHSGRQLAAAATLAAMTAKPRHPGRRSMRPHRHSDRSPRAR